MSSSREGTKQSSIKKLYAGNKLSTYGEDDSKNSNVEYKNFTL